MTSILTRVTGSQSGCPQSFLARSAGAFRWLGVLVAAASLSGCGLGSTTTTTTIRVADAITNTTPIDVYAGGGIFISMLHFGDITTYGFVPSGLETFNATFTGVSSVLIPTQDLNLNSGDVDTIVAAGAPGSSTNPPTFYLYRDDNTPPSSKDFNVRMINVAPAVGPIDVYFGGQKVVSDLAYGSAAPYVSLPAGTYNVTANEAGTSVQVASLTTSTALGGGHVYTFIVDGLVTNNSGGILAQQDV